VVKVQIIEDILVDDVMLSVTLSVIDKCGMKIDNKKDFKY